MTIYNRTKLCDSPLSSPREMEVRRGRARQGWRETVWGGETGGGGRMPHLHTFLRDIARHCGRWNKALSSVLFPFVVQVRGINKNVSRCWEARACGRKVIDVGWLTHPDFSDKSQWKPIYQKSPAPMQNSKSSAVVKHSKAPDVSCTINHSLMDASD